MQKRIILGTAGHIDHGKTSVVKSLTGVDTDRLKEEKERGITIELGFTSLTLPGGQQLGIVDMPGHEKFIDHMVAGASGIDMVLLVVAADEGVMPQTREHLDICRLLGIRSGLVVLTKVDLVDGEMEALALEDVKELVQGTFLEARSIVSFSFVTGKGREELLAAIEQVATEAEEKSSEGLCRLPIDRVFTMKGFGTVLTGTLLSGSLHVGDTVEILPSGHMAKVRGIQTHNQAVEESRAGARTAVNLQGIEKSLVQRGEILVEPGRFNASYMVYAYFQYIPRTPKPLADRFRLMFHWGTAKVHARIMLIGADSIAPGEGVWAQFRLEEPVVPVFGDRFIVRDFSTNRTLGGGIILDPYAPKYRKKAGAEIIPWLTRLKTERPEERVTYFIWKQGYHGASVLALAAATNLPLATCRDVCHRLASKKLLTEFDSEQEIFVLEDSVKKLTREIRSQLESYHRENPYHSGLLREELKGRLRDRVPEKLYTFSLSLLEREGTIAVDREKIRLATHTVRLSGESQEMEKEILSRLEAADLHPPSFRELMEQIGCPENTLHVLLEYLTEKGSVLKISEELYFHPRPVERLKVNLVKFLKERGEIQTQEFKALSDTTRKYTIPLLEYFDRLKITLRLGDRRVLRDKENELRK